MPRLKTSIEFDAPAGASMGEIRDFIEDWLSSGGGCRHPNDPLLNSLSDIKVGGFTRITRTRANNQQRKNKDG